MMLPLAAWAAQRHFAAEARHRDFVATVPQQVAPRLRHLRSLRSVPSRRSTTRGIAATTAPMTQYASPESVRGDFADVTLTGGGYDVRLFRRGDDFMVDMVDPLWQYEVDFGQRDPLPPGQTPPRVERARLDDDRLAPHAGVLAAVERRQRAALGAVHLSLRRSPLGAARRRLPRRPDERHQEQVWNVSCIECHATAGQPPRSSVARTVPEPRRRARHRLRGVPRPRRGARRRQPESVPSLVAAQRRRRRSDHRQPAPPAARRAPPKSAGSATSLTDLGDDIYLGEGKSYVAGDELEKSQPLLRQLHPTPALAQAHPGRPLVSARPLLGRRHGARLEPRLQRPRRVEVHLGRQALLRAAATRCTTAIP